MAPRPEGPYSESHQFPFQAVCLTRVSPRRLLPPSVLNKITRGHLSGCLATHTLPSRNRTAWLPASQGVSTAGEGSGQAGAGHRHAFPELPWGRVGCARRSWRLNTDLPGAQSSSPRAGEGELQPARLGNGCVSPGTVPKGLVRKAWLSSPSSAAHDLGQVT